MIQEYSSKFFPTVLGIRKPRHATHRTPLSGGKSRGLEKASVHWHTVVYANKHRAEGRLETILPEYGVFCKRPTEQGNIVIHDCNMPSHLGNRTARSASAPDMHRPISAGRSQAFPVGRPFDVLHAAVMAVVGKQVGSFPGIPDLHLPIETAAGETRTIGRPRYTEHLLVMAAIGGELSSRDGIPDLHGLIIAG